MGIGWPSILSLFSIAAFVGDWGLQLLTICASASSWQMVNKVKSIQCVPLPEVIDRVQVPFCLLLSLLTKELADEPKFSGMLNVGKFGKSSWKGVLRSTL